MPRQRREWPYEFTASIWLSLLIGLGFLQVFPYKEFLNSPKILWELILFCFIVGTLILTMSDKVLRKDQKEPFPRLGSLIIISGVFLIISLGVYSLTFWVTPYIGLIFLLISGWLLSFALANLLIEFAKTIIDI